MDGAEICGRKCGLVASLQCNQAMHGKLWHTHIAIQSEVNSIVRAVDDRTRLELRDQRHMDQQDATHG